MDIKDLDTRHPKYDRPREKKVRGEVFTEIMEDSEGTKFSCLITYHLDESEVIDYNYRPETSLIKISDSHLDESVQEAITRHAGRNISFRHSTNKATQTLHV